MGVYHIPHDPRRRALNPATAEGCQGQELPAWLGRLPREHRQGMLMFLSQGRGGCASDHNGNPVKPLPLGVHSLTEQTLESKEQWSPCIPCIPKDGEPRPLLLPLPSPGTRPDISPVPRHQKAWSPLSPAEQASLLLGSLAST